MTSFHFPPMTKGEYERILIDRDRLFVRRREILFSKAAVRVALQTDGYVESIEADRAKFWPVATEPAATEAA